MKFNRWNIILIGLVMVTLSGLFTNTGYSQEEHTTFLPLILDHHPFTPSFGVEIHSNFGGLSLAEEADNYWVRLNGLLWSEIQPDNATQWNWWKVAELEDHLIDISNSGMEVILIIRSTPTWAQKYSGIYCGPMKSDYIDEFANFINKVVKRYSAPPFNVLHYEIWNEPDAPVDYINPTYPYGCWGELNDTYFGGGYYATMLKSVYPKVKAANSKAQVVLGGLLLDCDPRLPGTEGYCLSQASARPPKFFEGVLRNGGGDYFDIINFHGYNYYDPNISVIKKEKLVENWKANGGQIEGKLDYIRELQNTYNIADKAVFLSEAGLLFAGTTDGQIAKAEYLVWLYTRNIARGISATTWYTLDGPGWRDCSLLDANQNPLPAYNAFKILTTALDGALYQKDLSLGSGIIAFEFLANSRVWVLFSNDLNQKSISIPSGFHHAIDLFGVPVNPVNGKINFTKPIFVFLID